MGNSFSKTVLGSSLTSRYTTSVPFFQITDLGASPPTVIRQLKYDFLLILPQGEYNHLEMNSVRFAENFPLKSSSKEKKILMTMRVEKASSPHDQRSVVMVFD